MFVCQGWHKAHFFETCCLDSARWNRQGLLSLSLLLSEVAQTISLEKGEFASTLAGKREQGEMRSLFFLSSNPQDLLFSFLGLRRVRNPKESNSEYARMSFFQAVRDGIFCL